MYRALSFLVLFLTLPTPAWSQEETASKALKGWYAGGGLTLNNVYSWQDNYDWGGDADYGDSDVGFILTGGYRFMRYFAVELDYLDSGAPEWDSVLTFVPDLLDVFNVKAKIDLTSYQASALGIFPFAKIWEVYIRGGLSFWDAKSKQTLVRVSDGQVVNRTIDETGTDFLLGVGGGVTLGGHWHIRLDYVYFGIDDDLMVLGGTNRDAYSDSASLAVLYRFGGNQ